MPNAGAVLYKIESGLPTVLRVFPTEVDWGISALAATEQALYMGMGLRESGQGVTEVWRYDGTNFKRLAGNDILQGGGVQVMLAAGNTTADACGTVAACQINPAVDCDSNHIVDTCQSDQDGDGIQDACDPDIDGDTVPNTSDNCPGTPNVEQYDYDHDNIGDACDLSTPSLSLFDYDHDGDVDADDFGAFQMCYSGDSFVQTNCCAFDYDGDGKVGECDFNVLSQCLGRSRIPADPWCEDINHNGVADPREGIGDPCPSRSLMMEGGGGQLAAVVLPEGGESLNTPDTPPGEASGFLNVTPNPAVTTVEVPPGGVFQIDLRVTTDGAEVSAAQAQLIASAGDVFTVVGLAPLNSATGNHASFNDNDPADPAGWDADDPLGAWDSNQVTGLALKLPGGGLSPVGANGLYGTVRVGDPLTAGSSRVMTLEVQVTDNAALIGNSYTISLQELLLFTSIGDALGCIESSPITVQVVAP